MSDPFKIITDTLQRCRELNDTEFIMGRDMGLGICPPCHATPDNWTNYYRSLAGAPSKIIK